MIDLVVLRTNGSRFVIPLHPTPSAACLLYSRRVDAFLAVVIYTVQQQSSVVGIVNYEKKSSFFIDRFGVGCFCVINNSISTQSL